MMKSMREWYHKNYYGTPILELVYTTYQYTYNTF